MPKYHFMKRKIPILKRKSRIIAQSTWVKGTYGPLRNIVGNISRICLDNMRAS